MTWVDGKRKGIEEKIDKGGGGVKSKRRREGLTRMKEWVRK